jgi:hypothetical protein
MSRPVPRGPRPVAVRAIGCIIYDVGGTLLYPAPPVEELAAFAEQAGGFRLDHARLRVALPSIRHFFAAHDQPPASPPTPVCTWATAIGTISSAPAPPACPPSWWTATALRPRSIVPSCVR